MENFLSETCDFLITWSGLLIPMIGCGGAILLFYRKKIQPPLDTMSQALEAIAREEWEHSIDYQNRDELGQLCGKFEQMRLQLKDNNRKLWGMIEEEKPSARRLPTISVHRWRCFAVIRKCFWNLCLRKGWTKTR